VVGGDFTQVSDAAGRQFQDRLGGCGWRWGRKVGVSLRSPVA
jgi:hypothetical protein